MLELSMKEILQNIQEGILATSLLEWIAVVTGVLYVILAAKKKMACWTFAIISSGIYVYLCATSNLLIESFLQVFYVLMAIAGWYFWNKSKDQEELVKVWRLDFHLLNVTVSTVILLAVGYYFDTYTDQDYPYLDAFTTVYSIAATFMVTQRVLENWLYWIVIDMAAVFLYAAKDFYLTALLYFIFTILAVFGYLEWRKKYQLQQQ